MWLLRTTLGPCQVGLHVVKHSQTFGQKRQQTIPRASNAVIHSMAGLLVTASRAQTFDTTAISFSISVDGQANPAC